MCGLIVLWYNDWTANEGTKWHSSFSDVGRGDRCWFLSCYHFLLNCNFSELIMLSHSESCGPQLCPPLDVQSGLDRVRGLNRGWCTITFSWLAWRCNEWNRWSISWDNASVHILCTPLIWAAMIWKLNVAVIKARFLAKCISLTSHD